MSTLGAKTFGPIRKFLPGSVDSDMSAPSAESGFVVVSGYDDVLWYVKLGTGCTSYTASIYRWVKAPDGQSGSGYAVLEDSFTSETTSKVFRQPAWGDPVAIRLHSMAGTVSADFEVRYKGINP